MHQDKHSSARRHSHRSSCPPPLPGCTAQLGFSPDDVNSLIKESVDAVLAGQQYSEVKVGQWTSACLEGCMQRLSALERPYKYVVTCIIMQKTGGSCVCVSVGKEEHNVLHGGQVAGCSCVVRRAACCHMSRRGAIVDLCVLAVMTVLTQVLGFTRQLRAIGTAAQTAAGRCAGRTRPCGASPQCLAWPCDGAVGCGAVLCWLPAL